MIGNDRIADAWGLGHPLARFPLAHGGLNNETFGIETADGRYVVKVTRTERGQRAALKQHEVSKWLAARAPSFAIPVPLATLTGGIYTEIDDAIVTLTRFFPGQRPDTTDATVAGMLGAALAALHRALADFDGLQSDPPYGALTGIHPRITHPADLVPDMLDLDSARERDELCDWWHRSIASLQPFLDNRYSALPTQWIHGDFAPGNALVHKGRVSAILDFEFAGRDARAIDVAAGFKLVACDDGNMPDVSGVESARAFVAGYETLNPLEEQETRDLPALVALRDAVACTWWIGRDLETRGKARPDRLQHARRFQGWLAEWLA